MSKLTAFIRACDSSGKPGSWPDVWPVLLTSLAFDRAGDWNTAHTIAQDVPDTLGSAVHAYLHRKEGVQWNAEYWYSRAGRESFTGTLDEEWESLASEILG